MVETKIVRSVQVNEITLYGIDSSGRGSGSSAPFVKSKRDWFGMALRASPCSVYRMAAGSRSTPRDESDGSSSIWEKLTKYSTASEAELSAHGDEQPWEKRFDGSKA